MCISCHGTPEDTLKELTNIYSTKDYKFNDWNTTSVNHLIISMSNHDGPKCKEIATKILKEFVKWYEKNKNDNYFPECGLEQMYSLGCLNELIYLSIANKDMDDKKLMKLFSDVIENHKKNTPQKTLKMAIDDARNATRWFYIEIGVIVIGASYIMYRML